MPQPRADIIAAVPAETVAWLLEPDNPAVAALTRRTLLGAAEDDPEVAAAWARRNEYAPVAAILDAQQVDGSWAKPAHDYQKYGGSLWQVHFLGELWADGGDPRIEAAAEYAFSRQLADGSWSYCDAKPGRSIPCLTANVARALARLRWGRDPRVLAALEHLVALRRELGTVDCRLACDYHLNGHCHMLTPKELLLLAEVPRDLWPDGAEELRDECVSHLRRHAIFRSLPAEAGAFGVALAALKPSQRCGYRERFIGEVGEVHYGEKSGWLRFGFPLSYNSDALEALAALAGVGEAMRPEYAEGVELVRTSADAQMRWVLKNSFNGKTLASVETRGRPSKWLTLRALQVLEWAGPA